MILKLLLRVTPYFFLFFCLIFNFFLSSHKFNYRNVYLFSPFFLPHVAGSEYTSPEPTEQPISFIYVFSNEINI